MAFNHNFVHVKVLYFSHQVHYVCNYRLLLHIDVVFSPAVGLSGGSIAGIILGSLFGVFLLVLLSICVGVYVVYNSGKSITHYIPRTIMQSHSYTRVSTVASTSFTTTSPRDLTAQASPSFAATSQYPTADLAKAPEEPPVTHENRYGSHEQLLTSSPTPPSTPNDSKPD